VVPIDDREPCPLPSPDLLPLPITNPCLRVTRANDPRFARFFGVDPLPIETSSEILSLPFPFSTRSQSPWLIFCNLLFAFLSKGPPAPRSHPPLILQAANSFCQIDGLQLRGPDFNASPFYPARGVTGRQLRLPSPKEELVVFSQASLQGRPLPRRWPVTPSLNPNNNRAPPFFSPPPPLPRSRVSFFIDYLAVATFRALLWAWTMW